MEQHTHPVQVQARTGPRVPVPGQARLRGGDDGATDKAGRRGAVSNAPRSKRRRFGSGSRPADRGSSPSSPRPGTPRGHSDPARPHGQRCCAPPACWGGQCALAPAARRAGSQRRLPWFRDVAGAARYLNLPVWMVRDFLNGGHLRRVRLQLGDREFRRVLVDRADLDNPIQRARRDPSRRGGGSHRAGRESCPSGGRDKLLGSEGRPGRLAGSCPLNAKHPPGRQVQDDVAHGPLDPDRELEQPLAQGGDLGVGPRVFPARRRSS